MSDKKISSRIFLLEELLSRAAFWRTLGESVVFTNGCFDILHPGHLQLLSGCAALGDRVVVGLNADASVKRLKGPSRPLNNEQTRAQMLAANIFIDAVVIFNEDTPEKLIHALRPDVLVKGGDWQKEQIVGADFVEGNGGKVCTIPFLEGFSTTGIIDKVK